MISKNLKDNAELEKLRFPIGKFEKPNMISDQHLKLWINVIEQFPIRLKNIISGLNGNELNWRYRPEGWSIKQVIHHCADSHMNSFSRFKLCLTEDTPTIKPYFEDRWAELPDTTEANISDSIIILEGLHSRWTNLLKSLNSEDLKKQFIHPEHNQTISLEENIGIYAWHSNHHLAHIEQAKKYAGTF